MKLNSAMQRVPDQDLRAVSRMNAFFIIPTSVKQSAATLFMTHPPMEKRIERLQQYEAQLQGTAVAA
jgi:heat shock protein HtpX